MQVLTIQSEKVTKTSKPILARILPLRLPRLTNDPFYYLYIGFGWIELIVAKTKY